MDKYKIITDARVAIPNAHIPGRVGIGYATSAAIIINSSGTVVAEIAQYIGEVTVPVAELTAIIHGMEEAVAHTTGPIEIWSDSELAIRWLNGVYRQKKAHIRPLIDKIRALEDRYNRKEQVVYCHHPRTAPLAQQADRLAEQKYKEVRGEKA